MADFVTAIAKVLKNEGGILRDKDGVTNFGICSKYNPDVDVEHLTREEAQDWYYKNYWTPMRLFFLSDDAVVKQLLDAGVNCGKKRTVMLAQRAFNDTYTEGALTLDGVMGPQTVLAINEQKYPHAFFNALIYERVRHYLEILAAHPDREQNRTGWLNRI